MSWSHSRLVKESLDRPLPLKDMKRSPPPPTTTFYSSFILDFFFFGKWWRTIKREKWRQSQHPEKKYERRRANTDGRRKNRPSCRRRSGGAATSQQGRWMTFYLWTLSLNETSRGQTMASQTHSHRQARSEKQMLSVCLCGSVVYSWRHKHTLCGWIRAEQQWLTDGKAWSGSNRRTALS